MKQGTTPPQIILDHQLGEFIKLELNKTPQEENKEAVRKKFQDKVFLSFLTDTRGHDVQDKNYNFFLKYIRLLRTQGSGIQQRRKMIGRGLNTPWPVKDDLYLKLGKYKANKKNY